MRAGALLLGLAALAAALFLIAGAGEPADGPNGEPVPRERGAAPPPDFPVALHAEPPGKDGDVSRAFVNPDGERVVLNGVNLFPVFDGSITWRQSDYDDIAAKGFTAVRFLLTWDNFQPEPGRFQHLELLDQAVRQARDAGLYVVMLNIIVDEWNSPPGWATGRDKLEQISKRRADLDPGARPPLPRRGRGGGLRSGGGAALERSEPRARHLQQADLLGA